MSAFLEFSSVYCRHKQAAFVYQAVISTLPSVWTRPEGRNRETRHVHFSVVEKLNYEYKSCMICVRPQIFQNIFAIILYA